MEKNNKFLDYVKIYAPTITFLSYIKLSVFYSQFHINILQFYDISEFIIALLKDLPIFLVVGAIVFVIYYLPFGINIIEENSKYFEGIITKSFWERIRSHLIRNLYLVLILIFYLYFDLKLNGSFLLYIGLSTIISIIITEWMIKEFRISGKIISPFYHNYIIGVTLSLLTIVNSSIAEAEKIKIDCKNELKTLILNSNDTFHIEYPILFIGKSKNYVFLSNNETNSPIVISEKTIYAYFFN